MTPLVDTLFLLLFALLTVTDARRAHASEEVHVELPQIEPADESAPAPGTRIVLEVTSDSKVLLQEGGAVLSTADELDRQLASTLGDLLPEDVVIEIHADRRAPYGVALDLLQHLRLRGFFDIQLVAAGTDGRPSFGSER